MKRIGFIIILMLITLWASGQQSRGMIEGIVTDKEGNPVAAAYVVIDSLNTGVTTGNDGRYMIRGLKAGAYTLRYSFVGYNTETRDITLDGDAVSDVVLTETTLMTDEIVIRANRAGSRTPMAYSDVEGSLLRKNDVTRDIPYLLALTPSVVETSEAGNGIGYTSLRIRGTDANRINVTIDGIPLNDPESQQVFWVDLPDLVSSTGRIQIQRGVGTSTNGSAAFGASMNINTMSLPDEPGASVDFSAGSFHTYRVTARVWSGDIDERFKIMIRASSIASDGYIEHSASDIGSVMVSGSWETSADRLRFNILTGRERTGISWWGVPKDSLEVNRRFNPAGIYTDYSGKILYYDDETDNYKQNHYHLFYTHKFAGRMALNTGLHLTKGAGYYEEQKSDRDLLEYGLGEIVIGEDTITETDLIQRKWLSNDFYGAVLSFVRTGHKTEWIAGAGANRYDGDHFGNIMWMEYPGTILPGYEWYRGTGLKDEVNIYGKVNSEISDRFNCFVDLQYRFIGYRITGLDDDMRDLAQNHYFRFFNPKAGLFWNNGRGSDAFISASVAHREPTRSNFTDAAGDENVTPRPERLIDIESGYQFTTATLNLSLNLYLMLYHDQLVPTGKISNTGYSVMTNVAESYRAGIEFSGNYRPSSLAAFKMNLTISRNKIKNFRNYYFDYNTSDWTSSYTWSDLGNVDIAYSPSVTGSAEVEVNPLKRLSLRLNGKYVGKQYFDNTMNNDRSIAPYFVSNMSADYKIKPRKPEEINLRFQLNNIFNHLYENNAYGGMWMEDGDEKTWAYYFPQAGLNFMCGLSITF